MLEARVDLDKLNGLLAEAHEHEVLEYVGACDLDARRDVVELASEVAAMAMDGGYIVIGADDHGRPTGAITDTQARLFDDASLRDKLGRYLPADLEIHSGRHKTDAGWLVVIYVAPHPDGAVVFRADGTYQVGRAVTAFRKGDVYRVTGRRARE